MVSDASAKGVLGRILVALKAANVPYMLTGSFASAIHGAPRTTQDIDIVIAPSPGGLKALLRQFPDDAYYVSPDTAMQAYRSEGLFNVVDFVSGWKVDFIIRKSRPFSVEEFDRRQETQILGSTVAIASPEDVVLAKLEWAKMTESQRQLSDVAGILRIQGDNLDVGHIDRWVNDLQLQKQWEDAKALAV